MKSDIQSASSTAENRHSVCSDECFAGSFTQQEPLPDDAIAAATRVLRQGRLHRYNTADDELAETSLLEQEFAQYIGARYALALGSGGQAITTALRALSAKPPKRVLTNAFTLPPVPGAIIAAGAEPILVGVTTDLTIDFSDLAAKINQASVLLLSHMRGHICDMDKLMAICDAANVTVIEDCAHTMGANWNGLPTGRYGKIACFSCQTYKHMNSGEGGFLVTDDPEIAARAILLSGSYMLYQRHLSLPPSSVFEQLKHDVPNLSCRMDNLRAAILRPQLRRLPQQTRRWNARYQKLEEGLRDTPGLRLIKRPQEEAYVGSSIQFLLLNWPEANIRSVVNHCAARGVELKWFGAKQPVGFTSTYNNWNYLSAPSMPETDHVLKAIVDMRIPLTFELDDCELIAHIIRQEVAAEYQQM